MHICETIVALPTGAFAAAAVVCAGSLANHKDGSGPETAVLLCNATAIALVASEYSSYGS